MKTLYKTQGGKFPDPIMSLTFDYKDPLKPDLDEIAKEINGKDLSTGKQMTTFANLKDDGTTTTGDWIYTGSYLDTGNLMKRRQGIQDPHTNDPTGMGFYPNWSWSWPLNRRVMYNRASADLNGKAWDAARPGITWNGSKWVGDVPDYPATMDPHDPNAYLPFIKGEGCGQFFSDPVFLSRLDKPPAEDPLTAAGNCPACTKRCRLNYAISSPARMMTRPVTSAVPAWSRTSAPWRSGCGADRSTLTFASTRRAEISEPGRASTSPRLRPDFSTPIRLAATRFPGPTDVTFSL